MERRQFYLEVPEQEFASMEGNSLYVIDLDYRNIVLQLPGDSQLKPLRLHTEDLPKRVQGGHGQVIYRPYNAHLLPQGAVQFLYTDIIYRAGTFSTLEMMKVPKPTLSPHGNLYVHLPCPGDIILLANGACSLVNPSNEIPPDSPAYIPPSREEPWCGEHGGGWQTHIFRQLRGGGIYVVKRKLHHRYPNQVMTCMWRQYLCYHGTRTKPLLSFTHMDPDPSFNDVSYYIRQGEDVVRDGYKTVIAPELLQDNSCSWGEGRGDPLLAEGLYPHASPQQHGEINFDTVRAIMSQLLRHDLTSPLHSQEFKVPAQLSSSGNCPCRQKMNLCGQKEGHVASATLELGEADVTDGFQCDVAGSLSHLTRLDVLVFSYACSGDKAMEDVVHLQAFLPRPMGHISNAPVFISGKKFYTITCTNVHRACAERKTREATPIENNQSFLTYKVLLYESQGVSKSRKGLWVFPADPDFLRHP